jgi:hypothetical protein
MPPPFAEQDKIQKTLDRIGRNDVTLSFVDWSCAEVDDEYLEKLGTALKGNTFVRKVHLNFNPAVTDAGAAALEAALPGCNVVAAWADNTGASELTQWLRSNTNSGIGLQQTTSISYIRQQQTLNTPSFVNVFTRYRLSLCRLSGLGERRGANTGPRAWFKKKTRCGADPQSFHGADASGLAGEYLCDGASPW